MSDTKISGAASSEECLRAFNETLTPALRVPYAMAYRIAINAALEVAHRHPQPAELAEQQGVYIGMPVGEKTVARAVASLGQSLTFAQDFRAEDVRIVLAALAATGKQQVGEDCTAILAARIALEVELCGSLQRVAKELSIDVGYLSRLARGEKTNPSDEVLEKLGLERTVTYTPIKREYVASPLHPRTKSA